MMKRGSLILKVNKMRNGITVIVPKGILAQWVVDFINWVEDKDELSQEILDFYSHSKVFYINYIEEETVEFGLRPIK